MPRRKTTDTVQLKLRFREDLRRKLEREASRQKISLNSEIVARLERSFEQEARVADLMGGPETAALLRIVRGEIELAKQETVKHAPDDVKAGQAVARVFATLAWHLFPECKWVRIGTVPEEEGRSFKYSVPSLSGLAALPSAVKLFDAKTQES